ncbi:MAG: 30S ribosomal protein S7 [Anaerolineales bacterium]|jgi:small subunit ribosomal protein S7
MSRRERAVKRATPPDIRYKNTDVQGLIHLVMRRGKKSVAAHVVYGAFDLIQERSKREPVGVFQDAIRNVGPTVEVKPRRVGGATYQVPVEVESDRRNSLAMRWIIVAAKARPGKSMIEKLAGELMDAATSSGAAVKRREEVHKMAEANRAFAHYRW